MLAASRNRLWALAALCALLGLDVPAARADVALPGNTRLEKVDFEQHIMGLFGRMGCNAGGCHGSFQGKGGFRLSLFGYEPDKDYLALTRDQLGRRVNAVNPDASLLLLKATGQVEHQGGMRFSKDSWQYRVFREWIVSGARWQQGSGDVKAIRVTPAELPFRKAGEEVQVRVTATFADGGERDITHFSDFRTNDDAVAEVNSLGVAKSIKPGSTAIIVTYRGNVIPVRVLVPMQLPANFAYPKVPEVNYIDREVFARLKKLNMVPSDLADDNEFLRRITIDTIGSLPTPEEVRTFLASKDPNKRARKIEELLNHPMHAALWATKFCDITGNDTPALEQPVALKAKRSQQWHEWFRKRVAQNMPYDEIVRGVLTATSRDNQDPTTWLTNLKVIDAGIEKGHDTDKYAERASLDLFWRRQQNVAIEQWGEKTAAAFLGVRLECAQCHKHPFDRWSQAEYRAYANIFSQVTFGISPESKKVIDAENMERRTKEKKNNQLNLVKEVFVGNPNKMLLHPDTGKYLGARTLGGPEIKMVKGADARVALFEWMRSPDNQFFARSFVNRVWGHYFGVGIVHPVDDFSLANPASNDRLLDALAQDFIASKFDIRALERKILNSRTYQLTSKTNDTNKFDRINYAHSYVRPMMAEVVVDVLNSALGATEKFGAEIKPGSRAVEVGASLLNQSPALNYAFRIFGRPPRTAACDCERTMEPALPQKLYLMTDQGLLAKFNAADGRLQQLLKSKMTDDQVFEELFLATLTRQPSADDRQLFNEYRQSVRNRNALFSDVLWALINTREFILNH
jgi:hypothetical protein